MGSLESLFTEYQCKKVEKLDRSRRLLAYPIKENIEAYVILYTFKGPRTMPKAVIGIHVAACTHVALQYRLHTDCPTHTPHPACA